MEYTSKNNIRTSRCASLDRKRILRSQDVLNHQRQRKLSSDASFSKSTIHQDVIYFQDRPIHKTSIYIGEEPDDLKMKIHVPQAGNESLENRYSILYIILLYQVLFNINYYRTSPEAAKPEVKLRHHDPPQFSSMNFCTLPRRPKSGACTFHTILFEKGPGKKSLGFTVVGGRDSPKGNMGIFIKSILEAGQAADDGRLRAGDEILAVNGCVFDNLSHKEAVGVFKGIKAGPVALHVCRRGFKGKI